MPSIPTVVIVLASIIGLVILTAIFPLLFMSKEQAKQEDEEWAAFLKKYPQCGQ